MGIRFQDRKYGVDDRVDLVVGSFAIPLRVVGSLYLTGFILSLVVGIVHAIWTSFEQNADWSWLLVPGGMAGLAVLVFVVCVVIAVIEWVVDEFRAANGGES